MEDVSLNLKCEEEENHTESSGAIESKPVMTTIQCDGPVSSEQAQFDRPGIPDHKQSPMAFPPIQIEPETTAGSLNEPDAGTAGTTNSYSLIVQSEGGDAQEIVLEITMESGVAGLDMLNTVKSEEEGVVNINLDMEAITDPQDLNINVKCEERGETSDPQDLKVSDVRCEERGETSDSQDLNVSDVKCEERGETSDPQDLNVSDVKCEEMGETSDPQVSDVRCKEEDVKVELTTCHEGGEDEVERCFGESTVPQSTVQASVIYECPICFKVFRNRLLMADHSAHRDYRFKCEVCKRAYKYAKDLMIHKRTHTGEKPYTCRFCEKGFSESWSLRRHIFTHTGEKPYKCQFCDKSFRQSSTCREHTMVHTGEKPYKCDVCGKRFIRSGSLTKHVRFHTRERSYICVVCGKGFTTFNLLHYHLESHRPAYKFKCALCDKAFKSVTYLKVHKITHSEVRPYKCHICAKSFKRSDHLRRHILMLHQRKKQEGSDVSGKQSALSGEQSALSGEQSALGGEQSALGGVQSALSGEQSALSSNVQEHGQNNTGVMLKTVDKSLNMDKGSILSTYRQHKYHNCDKSFKCAANLQKHILSHQKKKLTGIDVCVETPVLAGNSQEQQQIHKRETVDTFDKNSECSRPTTIRQYKCPVCSQEFTSRNDYRAHQRTHKAKRSYNCTVCHKKLTTAQSLKSHKQTHTVIPLIL